MANTKSQRDQAHEGMEWRPWCSRAQWQTWSTVRTPVQNLKNANKIKYIFKRVRYPSAIVKENWFDFYSTCMRNRSVPPEIGIPPDVTGLESTLHASSLKHIQLVLPAVFYTSNWDFSTSHQLHHSTSMKYYNMSSHLYKWIAASIPLISVALETNALGNDNTRLNIR